MRLRNVLTAAAAVLFSALLSSSPARADFIFDLAVGLGWTGSGSIDLTALSGTSTVDVAGFSFHVATSVGSPQDYALADINTISWSIDASDNLSLLLSSDLKTFGSDQTAIVLTNESGFYTDPCFPNSSHSGGSLTCEAFASGGEASNNFGVLTATPTAVPEPASLLLLGTALAGVGFLRRRRPRRGTQVSELLR